MQDVSSSLFESLTDGTAYHKKQLSVNVFKNQLDRIGNSRMGYLWTHGPRNPMDVQCKNGDVCHIRHVSDNSNKC